MDLLALLGLTVRRWIVVLPVLFVTFAALGYVATNRGSDYSMVGSYMLVSGQTLNPSEDQLDPQTGAEVLADRLELPSVRQEMVDDGLSADYDVTVSSTGPTLRVEVRGDDAQQVTDTATRLVDIAPDQLEAALGRDAQTVAVRAVTMPTLADVTTDGDTNTLKTSLVVTTVPVNSGNPFPASLATVQSLISLAGSLQFEQQVADAAPGADYKVMNPIQTAPIVDLSVSAASADSAVGGYDFVRDRLDAELARLQDENSVNPSFRTVFRPIFESPPKPAPPSVVRPAAGIVILGTGLAIALAVFAESIAVGRRQRNAARRAGRHDEQTTEPAPDEGNGIEDFDTDSADGGAGPDSGRAVVEGGAFVRLREDDPAGGAATELDAKPGARPAPSSTRRPARTRKATTRSTSGTRETDAHADGPVGAQAITSDATTAAQRSAANDPR